MERPPKGQLQVVSLEIVTRHVSVRPGKLGSEKQVWIDETRQGQVIPDFVYPPQVSLIYVGYNDQRFGQKRHRDCLYLASTEIPFLRAAGLNTPLGLDSSGSHIPGKRRWRKNLWEPVTGTLGGVTYNFEMAKILEIGQILAKDTDTPFHWTSNSQTHLSNAPTWPTLIIPTRRPRGADWEEYEPIYFLQGISTINWPLLLLAVQGRYLDEILGWKGNLPSVLRLRAMINIANRGAQILAKIGQCFDGAEAHYVAIGENFLFTLERAGKMVYIVDFPEYGHGLYLFTRREQAQQWTRRAINFATARALAFFYTNHVGAWETDLRQAINEAFASLS